MGTLRGVRCTTTFIIATVLVTLIVGASAPRLTAHAADSRQLANAHKALQAGKFTAAIKAVNAAFEAGGLTSEQTSRGLYIRGTAQLARKRSAEAIADLNAALWTGHLPTRLDSRAKQQRAKAYAAAGIRTPPPVARRGTTTRKTWAAVSKPITTGTLPAHKARPSHKVAMPAPRVDRLPEGYKTPAGAVVSPARQSRGVNPRGLVNANHTEFDTLTTSASGPLAIGNAQDRYSKAYHRHQPRHGKHGTVHGRWQRELLCPRPLANTSRRPVHPRRPCRTGRQMSGPTFPPEPRGRSRAPYQRPNSPRASHASGLRRNLLPRARQQILRRRHGSHPPHDRFARTRRHEKIIGVPPAPSRSETPASPSVSPASAPNLGTLFGGLLGTSGSEKPDHIAAADELQRQRAQRIREHNRRLGTETGPEGDAPPVSQ